MYATVRRYTANPGASKNLSAKIAEEFVPVLKAIPGFVSYTVIDGEPEGERDVVVTMSVYDTRDGAEDSVRAAAKWVGENFADLGFSTPQITSGTVLVSSTTQSPSAAYTR